jgi:hypothetical protein
MSMSMAMSVWEVGRDRDLPPKHLTGRCESTPTSSTHTHWCESTPMKILMIFGRQKGFFVFAAQIFLCQTTVKEKYIWPAKIIQTKVIKIEIHL